MVDCVDVVAVVQEHVAGAPATAVSTSLVRALLDLHELQRAVLDEPSGDGGQLYLTGDGPGYCLHEPLRQHSTSTAALLDRVHDTAARLGPSVGGGRDIVHGDFHVGNVLVSHSGSDTVVGIVDWTGARGGDAGLDLVVLAFFLEHARVPSDVQQLVERRLLGTVVPDARLAFTAHVALRQVDWAIRHYDAAAVRSWTTIAARRLRVAERDV